MAASQKRNDASVQGTNDCSILSKHAMSEAGYFTDPYLASFTLKSAPRRTPLINRGYYIRAKAIDTVIRRFVTCSKEPKQIVSLGAGFDTTYLRIASTDTRQNSLFFVEIDFPEVVTRKKRLIQQSKQTSELLDDSNTNNCHPSIKILTPHYCLLGTDLSKTSSLCEILYTVDRLHKDIPTLVLSECVMTYMECEESTKLIGFIRSFFCTSVFLTYEQVRPNDAFGMFMQSHFNKLNSTLKAISTYPTPEKQRERYRDCGYDVVDVVTMHQFFFSLPKEERQRIFALEYFDEFEEWHLKCSHYILVFARQHADNIDMETLIESFKPPEPKEPLHDFSPCKMLEYLSVGDGAEIHSHASAVIQDGSENYLVTHGGFGVSSGGSHSRQCAIRAYKIHINGNEELSNVGLVTEITVLGADLLPSRMHHTFTALDGNRVFVFGGRLSPAKPHAKPILIQAMFKSDGCAEICVEQNCTEIGCPEPRWRHSSTQVVVSGKECVLIAGGKTCGDSSMSYEGICLSSVYLYIVVEDQWIKLPDLPSPRHSHSACSDGKHVFVVGGIDEDEQLLKDCLLLDLQAMTGWQNFTCNILPVYSSNLHSYGDCLILVGGIGLNGEQLGLQTLKLSKLEHTHYSLPTKVNGCLRMYFNHTSHVLMHNGNSYLTIIGGGGNCFSFGTHINRHTLLYSLPSP